MYLTTRSVVAFAVSLAAVVVDAKLTTAEYFYRNDRPMVSAHRGSFGQFPEHSLGAYIDAYYAGSDFIEIDLQVTKDGYLVANHDSTLNVETDVLEKVDLFTENETDGKYYVDDFTLAELKQLRRR